MENEWRNEVSASSDSEEFYKSYVHKMNVGKEEGREMKVLERRLLCGGFSHFEAEVIMRAVEENAGTIDSMYLNKTALRIYDEATKEEEE